MCGDNLKVRSANVANPMQTLQHTSRRKNLYSVDNHALSAPISATKLPSVRLSDVRTTKHAHNRDSICSPPSIALATPRTSKDMHPGVPSNCPPCGNWVSSLRPAAGASAGRKSASLVCLLLRWLRSSHPSRTVSDWISFCVVNQNADATVEFTFDACDYARRKWLD